MREWEVTLTRSEEDGIGIDGGIILSNLAHTLRVENKSVEGGKLHSSVYRQHSQNKGEVSKFIMTVLSACSSSTTHANYYVQTKMAVTD